MLRISLSSVSPRPADALTPVVPSGAESSIERIGAGYAGALEFLPRRDFAAEISERRPGSNSPDGAQSETFVRRSCSHTSVSVASRILMFSVVSSSSSNVDSHALKFRRKVRCSGAIFNY